MRYIALLFLASCATAGQGAFMGCVDPTDPKCPDPTAYPSLRAQLPPWPFPVLIEEPAPPPPQTPEQEAAERLLQKLGK